MVAEGALHWRAWALGLLLCLARTASAGESTSQAPAAPATVQVQIDHGSLTVGETLTYTFTLTAAPGVELSLPVLTDRLAELPIVARGHTPSLALDALGSQRQQHWLRLQPAHSGSFIIPPQLVTWRRSEQDGGQLTTPEIYVEVRAAGVPPPAPEADIHPLKPLWILPLLPTWAWCTLALLATVGLALLARARWRRRRSRQAPAPPPEAVALAQLQHLLEQPRQDSAAIRRYVFRLSSIVRAYLEARFGLNATDLTSEEILARLPEVALLNERAATLLRTFLAAGDTVKYAGSVPPAAVLTALHEGAVAFIEGSRLPPPVTGSPR